ncbi:MAG: Abi family protein [Lacrimispora sp.]|uniref:Abi family protein n=1 Tax=Lacrimispora sp. TaxID=2719234 RepID=UPI0039E3D1C3
MFNIARFFSCFFDKNKIYNIVFFPCFCQLIVLYYWHYNSIYRRIMTNMDFKSTDALMQHLRDNGIAISGSSQRQQLINTGYFHGYKGYRFFFSSANRLPFTSYHEIYSTIQYDTKLKSLLYGKIMFIETALKNIALNTIMSEINSSSIYDMYEKVVSSYKNSPAETSNDIKKRCQNAKLKLQSSIQNAISFSYQKENPKITHFYNNINYSEVPLWAVFEILTMGDFGHLLSCLTQDMRKKISRQIGINTASDTNCELLYKYVYALKDLRNAIAHNDVVYDVRFRKFDASRPMRQCLILEMGLPYINFKTIGDYIILICYYLKILKVPQAEIKAFIREFEEITAEYKQSVNSNVVSAAVHPDSASRMAILKDYI